MTAYSVALTPEDRSWMIGVRSDGVVDIRGTPDYAAAERMIAFGADSELSQDMIVAKRALRTLFDVERARRVCER